MKKKNIAGWFGVILVAGLSVGCTPGIEGRVGSTGGQVEGWRLTTRDMADMSTLLTDDLLSNPYINRADGKRHVIAISRIDTSSLSDRVNTRQLVGTITKALNDSGKVWCTVASNLDPGKNDPLLNKARELRNSSEVREGSKIAAGQIETPDHSLLVTITEERNTKRGGTFSRHKTEYVYTIEMRLNQLSTGAARWQGIENMSKVGPGLGRKY